MRPTRTHRAQNIHQLAANLDRAHFGQIYIF